MDFAAGAGLYDLTTAGGACATRRARLGRRLYRRAGREVRLVDPRRGAHRFHNEQTRALAGHLLGRRRYETMVHWETADDDRSEIAREFTLI